MTADPAGLPDPRAPHRGPWTGRRQAALDILLALLLSPSILAGLHSENGTPLHSTPLILAVALSLLATWSLALRRRHPATILATVVAAGLLLDLVLGGNSGALVPQIAVAVYTMALGRSWRSASLVAAATALAFMVSGAIAQRDLGLATAVSRAAVIGGATAVGLYMATRRAYVEALQQRNLHLEGERALLSQQAVAEERVRIARELHDVVAHHVSLLVVQAGGVRATLDPDHPARPVLESMAATGRQALDEMRRMLGLLRVGEVGATPELTPQPGLGDAGPARVRVALHHGEHALEIEVLDNGRGNLGAARAAGHGLVGMRERVALFGGELVTGPAPRGGFAVHASLPIDGPPR